MESDESGLDRIRAEIDTIGERNAQKLRAQKRGLGFVDLDRVVIGDLERQLLPIEVLRLHRVLPVKKDGANVYLAMEDPSDRQALEYVAKVTACRVIPVMVPMGQVDEMLALFEF
ncbi:MAG: hypothetical protein ACO1SV_13695 [Fimbriimonas sp.]